MNAVEQMLESYRRDHTHPVNRATHMLGIPMIIVSLPTVFVAPEWGVGLFVVGWIFQLIGHAFEGKAPSFVRDPRFLLVGAGWYVQKVWGALRRAPATSPEPSSPGASESPR